jgi:hypothetical protein
MERLARSSIGVTMNTYGQFPGDEERERERKTAQQTETAFEHEFEERRCNAGRFNVHADKVNCCPRRTR